MVFITGGAYQGKLDYAREQYGIRDEDVSVCTQESAPDQSRRCIVHLERYVRYCLQNGIEPELRFREDAVLIGDDIFCGVVPIEPDLRVWREETGRFYTQISRGAQSVVRLFCGLPLQLK